MPIWRLQCVFGGDSPDARDRFVITPHFNEEGILTSPQELCDDLADALTSWNAGDVREVVVKAYDAQGTPPVFPQGEATRNPGVFPESECPREVAVCLSFYSVNNMPRQRGRLYIPQTFLTTAGGPGTARPSAGILTKVGELAPIFADLGDTETDWSVYSRVDDVARPVSNWWVDNEWDTIRSRGLRPTSRLAGTVDES